MKTEQTDDQRIGFGGWVGYFIFCFLAVAMLIGAWGLVGFVWRWARSVWGI